MRVAAAASVAIASGAAGYSQRVQIFSGLPDMRSKSRGECVKCGMELVKDAGAKIERLFCSANICY